MPPMTVEDNLALVSKLHQRKFDQPLAKRLMVEVGLGDLSWSQNPAELSGGNDRYYFKYLELQIMVHQGYDLEIRKSYFPGNLRNYNIPKAPE
jgi:ABC-type iron transport system FetAB ATPase subunit